MNEYKILHLFSGIGGAALGFQEARQEYRGLVGMFRTLAGIDCDPEACQDFESLTGAPAVQMDLFTREDYVLFHCQEPPEDWQEAKPYDLIKASGLEYPDVVFLSPPCLPGKGTVLTPGAPKNIEDVRAGDLVFTHMGRYRKVANVGSHLYDGTLYGIRLNGTVDVQEFTAEHPLWRRKVIRRKAHGLIRELGEPEFVMAKDIRIGDRIGFPVYNEESRCARKFIEMFGDPQVVVKNGIHNSKHEAHVSRIIDLRLSAESSSLWFLIGAYLGDGYRRPERHEIMFCVGPEDGCLAERVRTSLKELDINWNEDKNGGKGNIKIRVHSLHLCQLCGAFGDGAENKVIPTYLMGLELPLLNALVEGYKETDGSEQGRRQGKKNELQARWKIPSVSLPLLRSLQRLLLRTGQFGRIHQCWPGGEQVIMGRTVQTKPRWELSVAMDPIKRTTAEFIDGAVWIRVRDITTRETSERVWNLEVEEDNTFCVPMMATHNCKGFSGLLPSEKSKSEKYQALNRLVIRGLHLTLDAYAEDLPAVIMIENVPRITTRGEFLLKQVKHLLGNHGYIFHEGYHDCGELGGLGQHRKRYLLIARNESKMSSFIYRPPKRKLKTIGDVIGPLPLPDDPAMGPMHRLPRLQWKTWVRLALIPAGGDWRDLENVGQYSIEHVPRDGVFQVAPWDKPSKTVVGHARPGGSNGVAAISDPRLPDRDSRHPAVYQVVKWDEPGPCVTGTRFGSGAPAVEDPRTGYKDNTHHTIYRVTPWEETSGTVTGAHGPSNGVISIADPRVPQWRNGWKLSGAEGRINEWDKPTDVVLGHSGVRSNGASCVADPRLNCKPRSGMMGVQDWNQPAKTVIGAGDIHAGATAVADPRIPRDTEVLDPPPIIIALDGTWHRPLTTLELAVLQSLKPIMPDGRPLQLAGNSDARWRERIGNMVPPATAQAIAEEILLSFLASEAKEEWQLSAKGIWVVPGRSENVYARGYKH